VQHLHSIATAFGMLRPSRPERLRLDSPTAVRRRPIPARRQAPRPRMCSTSMCSTRMCSTSMCLTCLSAPTWPAMPARLAKTGSVALGSLGRQASMAGGSIPAMARSSSRPSRSGATVSGPLARPSASTSGSSCGAGGAGRGAVRVADCGALRGKGGGFGGLGASPGRWLRASRRGRRQGRARGALRRGKGAHL
jgi:hypothetical protein